MNPKRGSKHYLLDLESENFRLRAENKRLIKEQETTDALLTRYFSTMPRRWMTGVTQDDWKLMVMSGMRMNHG